MKQSPPGIDRYEVAWLVRLALTGHWPHRQRNTQDGKVLLLEFPVFDGAQEAVNLRMGIVLREGQKIHLVDPDEMDRPALKRACVLAAEDDPDLASVIRAVLERGGFIVTHAANGAEAWRLVQNQSFDIALLDIDMPGLTGIEVCRRIKATPNLAHIPVVLCSGRLDLSGAALEAGADDFVEKPTGVLHLVGRLEKLLVRPGLRPKQVDEI
jgi:CheY-like chemotaxis protein